MPKVAPVQRRKAEHLRINLEKNVDSALQTGLEKLQFTHEALPELDLRAVDTNLELFGRQLRAPLLISSMTGGTAEASRINANLAEAASATGIAIGVGSQRAALEKPELAKSFQVRKRAPDALLFANLGAVQLNYGYGVDQCRRAVEMVGADALILHLNPLQEALQVGGNVDFSKLASKIADVCKRLGVPVVVKEVGWGISARTAALLADCGVAAIDVAGAGGTSWSQVEMHRAPDEFMRQLAGAFIAWGIPTADSITLVRQAAPNMRIFASGGLRNGIDVAKCIALGAMLGGMAGPFLKAAAESTERAVDAIRLIHEELRITMFAAGADDLDALRRTPLHDS
ncbi:MAG TPA: type 2 isopentenyl-diphosphate Delta-isomerase [Anaerolineales bacterium]